MTISKIAFHSVISTLFKSLSALFVIKILALEIGPDGLGEISNAFSLVAFATVFCIAGTGSGIIKHVAMSQNLDNVYSIIRISVYINIIITLILTFLSIFYSERFSTLLFLNNNYDNLLIWICLLTFPLGLSMISLAVMNGLRRAELISKYQFLGLIVGSISMYYLASEYGQRGAVFGLFIIPIMPIFYIVYILKGRFSNFLRLMSYKSGDLNNIYELLRYSWITIASILISTIVQFFYRAKIEGLHGMLAVGHWQAMIRISDGYSQIFMVFLMAYLLPNIARSKSNRDRIKYVNQTIVWILVPMIVLFCFIFIGRDLIIKIALTNEFMGISEYFSAQLLSDFFRIMSYVPGVMVLGLGRVKLSILMEVSQGVLLCIIGEFFISEYGAIGAVWSYLVSYLIYFSIVYFVYFSLLKWWGGYGKEC